MILLIKPPCFQVNKNILHPNLSFQNSPNFSFLVNLIPAFNSVQIKFFRFQLSLNKSTLMMHKSSLYLAVVLCCGITRFGGEKVGSIVRVAVEFFTLTEEQRKVVGEKYLDLGNIGAGALVFGTALAEGRIKWFYVIGGVLFWVLMLFIYFHLTKPRGKKDD
jgi:hypothetical protein